MKFVIFSVCAIILAENCQSVTISDKRHAKNDGNPMEAMREDRLDVIFPGTKWCGTGNVSKSEDDLGWFKRTDACCRAHDYCPDLIEGHKTKYNLTNPSFFTRLSCECDTEFYNCLKDAKSLVADKVGFLYFNVISTQCYKRDYPIKRCTKEAFVPRKKCKNYELDESKEKLYQFFDVPEY